MTVQQIINRIRRTFGDDSAVQINDSDIIGWINEAMKEIVVQLNLLQVIGTAATVANQSNYTLPADNLRLHSVKWQGNSLRYLSLEQAEESLPNKDDAANFPVGIPTHYWVWGNTITIYPAPASSGATDLKIYYNRMPVDVAAVGDIPELPTIYHIRIIEYCLAQAHDLDDNIFGAELKMGTFSQNLQSMRDIGDWAGQDFYPFITSTPGDTQDYTQSGYNYG